MEKSEALKFLEEFMTKIKAQNNRMTASPYFYVIRTADYVSSYHEGEGDRVFAMDKEDCETNFYGEDEEDCFQNFLLYAKDYEEYDNKDEDELSEIFEDNFDLYWERKIWKEECCFFTEIEAEEHLRLNHYHYSPDAHTYVKHFWRAPEVHNLFKALEVLTTDKDKK